MILTFPEVVSESEHREILGLVAAAEFVDGRETASPLLARTKGQRAGPPRCRAGAGGQ
jgi:predicted 2-oxoglutarate/Fe(II)-dependent dioxygenase YbiX